MLRLSAISVMLLLFFACSVNAVSPSREAYILAHEHGYLEIRVLDSNVESEPSDDPAALPLPPTCRLEVTADREPLLDEFLYPTGDSPPFTIDMGFRVPLSAKEYEIQLEYSDCRVSLDTSADNGDVAIESALRVQIESGMVAELLFDGTDLSLSAVRADTAPTLARVLGQLEAKCE